MDTIAEHGPAEVFAGDGAPLAALDLAAVRTALERRGAVLLRGFRTTVEDFGELGDALCSSSMANESPNREALETANRVQSVNLGGDPFPLHPELAREPWRPDLAMFACIEAPSVAGQTNVCDGIAIADALPAPLRQDLLARQLFYIRPASPELLTFWLGTAAPSDSDLAAPPAACPYWFRRAQGRILRGFSRPVLEPTLFQDEPAFANFLLFARDYLRISHIPLLNGGEQFPDDWLDEIRGIARGLTYSHKWTKGDVLLLDNSRFMHGRRAIGDVAERKIATYFGYLKGIERRPWDPPKPIWRQQTFVPPEAPPEN
jgi:hypothetical protein